MEKNNSMKALVVAVLIGVIGLAGFAIFAGGDDDTSTDTASQAAVEVSDNSDFPLDISFNNLEPLSEGIYEGWVVRGDDKHSFGTFNTNENSEVIGEFALDDITPEDGDTVVVTIEPVPDLSLIGI